MKHVLKTVGLWLLLIVAQQGAVVHELSHISRAVPNGLQVESRLAADTTCAQCPAFAQVVTPAFSHAFYVPPLVRPAAERTAAVRYAAIDTAAPQPRSRGPPSLS